MPDLFTGDTVAAASASAAPAIPADSPPADPSTAAAGVVPATDPASIAQTALSDGSTTVSDPATIPDKTVPPPEKWPTILANARTKATQETEAKYAWARQVHERHRATVGEFYQTLEVDPALAIESLINTAANDPIHAPKLRSLLGRLLRSGAGEERPRQSPDAPDHSPAAVDPDYTIPDANGTPVELYSAERFREAMSALEARLEAKYAKELDPLKTDYQTRAERARQAEATRTATDWAQARYAKVSQWREFKTYEAEIAAALAADPDLDIGDAYIEVVVPHLSQQERKAVVTHLQQKASAAGQNPSTPAAAVQAPPKTFQEAFARLPAEAWR